ncbi:MAG: hypothetical protein LBL93_04260, partial [Ruminococcus sp.]|nr:hypothetical protein [Ruminococcus sp.]
FLRAAVNTMPLWQWKSADSWFTVGNTDVIWKNFECIGIAITFTLFGILSIITYNLFKRRNLI